MGVVKPTLQKRSLQIAKRSIVGKFYTQLDLQLRVVVETHKLD